MMPEADYQSAWNIINGTTGDGYGNRPPVEQTADPLLHPSDMLFPFSKYESALPDQSLQALNQDGTGKAFNVTGGHHDAGDYSRYTINSATLIHNLIFAADNFPGVGSLNNLGIPESGNKTGANVPIGDLYDEAKIEADYLVKAQDKGWIDDGSANHNLVQDGGFYTLVYPKDQEYEADYAPDHAPPQHILWPKTTSVTAAAVAALAEIGSSPGFCSSFGLSRTDWVNNKYLAAAKLGWNFLMRGIDKYGKSGSFQKLYNYGDPFTHDDELAWAAAAMFAAGYSDTYEKTTGSNRFVHDPDFLLRHSWFPDPSDGFNGCTFVWDDQPYNQNDPAANLPSSGALVAAISYEPNNSDRQDTSRPIYIRVFGPMDPDSEVGPMIIDLEDGALPSSQTAAIKLRLNDYYDEVFLKPFLLGDVFGATGWPKTTYQFGWWRMDEGYGATARDYAFAVRSQRKPNLSALSTAQQQYLATCETALLIGEI